MIFYYCNKVIALAQDKHYHLQCGLRKKKTFTAKMLLSNKWRCHSPSFPAAEIPASPPGLWTWTPPPPIAPTNSKVKHFFLRHSVLVILDVILFPDFICMNSLNGFIICLCFHFITSASHLLFLWFTFPFSSLNARSLTVKLMSRPRNSSPLSKKRVLCRMA